jgi:hypothetical protein
MSVYDKVLSIGTILQLGASLYEEQASIGLLLNGPGTAHVTTVTTLDATKDRVDQR